jgi:hypothetical protein
LTLFSKHSSISFQSISPRGNSTPVLHIVHLLQLWPLAYHTSCTQMLDDFLHT